MTISQFVLPFSKFLKICLAMFLTQYTGHVLIGHYYFNGFRVAPLGECMVFMFRVQLKF